MSMRKRRKIFSRTTIILVRSLLIFTSALLLRIEVIRIFLSTMSANYIEI